MINIYYIYNGSLNTFNLFLKSLMKFLPNVEKNLIVISYDNSLLVYDEIQKNNINISIKIDEELSIMPSNKIYTLQKFITNNSEYSMFINFTVLMNEYNDESILDNQLHFGYIDKEDDMYEFFGFGSFIYGPTSLFNQCIKFGRDYEYVEDENRTDEQKFINFIKINNKSEYKECSDIFKFIE